MELQQVLLVLLAGMALSAVLGGPIAALIVWRFIHSDSRKKRLLDQAVHRFPGGKPF